MATKEGVTPEFVDSAISYLEPHTEDDQKMATMNALSIFSRVKRIETHGDESWDPEVLLSQLKPETLQKLEEVLDPAQVDKAVAPSVDINVLGKYVHNFVKSMLEEKAAK